MLDHCRLVTVVIQLVILQVKWISTCRMLWIKLGITLWMIVAFSCF